MRVGAMIGVILGLQGLSIHAGAAGDKRDKKVVFLAGKKSHGPGDHEYEKAMRLLARCVESSPNLKGYRTEVHLYGWPEDPRTLDDADTIVLYSDGADHDPKAHPFLVGDRMQTIGRQMKRGCGLVLIHYATIAPIGHDEFIEWAGGHFDYETGPGANHWASAIKFCDAKPALASPRHPISRGLTSFDLREEYYYKIRFRPHDSRLAPILTVNIPDESEAQTVAWAVQRKDGGRGFATTCGHPYTNFENDNLRRVLLNAIVWTAHGDVPKSGVESTAPKDVGDISALILTGHAHPAHDWRATTEAIKEALSRDRRINVSVWEDPEKIASDELLKYDLLIQNYQNWERPTLGSAARDNLLRFVREGHGLILVHFADGSWRDWPDYAGRLSRRVWMDGKSSHDPFGLFTVHIAEPNHLITQGVPDFTTSDELYCNQQGDLPIDPLIAAHSKITNKEEPLAYVYEEGKGRIFQILLGHAAESIRNPSVSEILRRAAAWCARREVLPTIQTQPRQ